MINPAFAARAESTLKDVQTAASAMGLQVQVLNASTSREIDAAFETFARERSDALFVGTDPFLLAGGCNLPFWPRATCSPQHMRRVKMPRSAGL